MGSDKRLVVALTLTPDPELLPVVQKLVKWLAERMGFGKSQRLNLQQGVEQACRLLMEKWTGEAGAEMRLEFAGFSDRLEIVVEDGEDVSEPTETDSFLLTQVLDRVAFGETREGKLRLTLVQYLSSGPDQP